MMSYMILPIIMLTIAPFAAALFYLKQLRVAGWDNHNDRSRLIVGIVVCAVTGWIFQVIFWSNMQFIFALLSICGGYIPMFIIDSILGRKSNKELNEYLREERRRERYNDSNGTNGSKSFAFSRDRIAFTIGVDDQGNQWLSQGYTTSFSDPLYLIDRSSGSSVIYIRMHRSNEIVYTVRNNGLSENDFYVYKGMNTAVSPVFTVTTDDEGYMYVLDGNSTYFSGNKLYIIQKNDWLKDDFYIYRF